MATRLLWIKYIGKSARVACDVWWFISFYQTLMLDWKMGEPQLQLNFLCKEIRRLVDLISSYLISESRVKLWSISQCAGGFNCNVKSSPFVRACLTMSMLLSFKSVWSAMATCKASYSNGLQCLVSSTLCKYFLLLLLFTVYVFLKMSHC